jgi:hypothetical protein
VKISVSGFGVKSDEETIFIEKDKVDIKRVDV